jgi:parvulin-like peptidyl-prolyl isomerase
MTIGGVVAEVNGTPIYADRVLNQVEKDLAAKARDMDAKQFRQYALQKLTEAREYCINNELEFAAAQRNLDEKDRQLADKLTTAWRQRQITEAGGSLELARRMATADGLNFEEQVQEQYRKYMTQIYYTKRVLPRIQITAQDMRDYYRTHKESEFTQHEQVRFRMIKIDPAAVGGREAAIAKVKEAQDKAARGFDFSELAKGYSTDPNLARTGGDVGWIQKGSFRLEKVEKAAFDLQPGQVSQNFIEEDGAFYVIKVEERKVGHVQPFEDPAVQDRIYATLRSQQFRALREQVIGQLTANAIIRKNNDLLQTAVDMAMQRYPQWAAIPSA